MEKSLAKNSAYNILYKVVAAIYPLVSAIYVSHILEAERVGSVSYAQNIVSYFVLLASLGIPSFGVREIAKCKNGEERSNLFNNLFWLNFLTTAVSIVLYLVLVFAIPEFSNNAALYLIAGIQLVFSLFNTDWLFQGLEEYKYISLRSILIKIFSLVALFAFIHDKDDYIIYALIFSVGIGGNNVLNMIRCKRYVKFSIKKANIFYGIKPILILFVASLAIELYTMIDITILGLFCDDSVVGCYSNAIKLTRMIISFCSAIGAVLLPRLTVIYNKGDLSAYNNLLKKALQIMLLFAIPSTVGIFLLADTIVPLLYGNSFGLSIPLLKILCLMIPIVVVNTLVGVQVFVSAGMEKKYTVCVVCGAVINVLLNFAFIPTYGAVSAAVSSLISEVVVLCMYLVYSRKVYKFSISLNFVASVALSMGLYIVLFYTTLIKLDVGPAAFVLINIASCVAILFTFSLVFKNDAVLLILEKIRRKRRL